MPNLIILETNMYFQPSYIIESKLKSISERLKYLARETNSARLYTNQDIKSENLRFNLSLVISKIILELSFIDRGINEFEKIIADYNVANNTSLKLDDFVKLGWIRVIAGEAQMPITIKRFVSQTCRNERTERTIEMPVGKADLIRCLQLYYQKCFFESKLTITKDRVENILSKFNLDGLTIDFLVEKEVIGFDKEKEVYYWIGGEYSRHLRNEIASTLWLLMGGENATYVQFCKYSKLINSVGIWIDDLGGLLNRKNTSKLSELAASFLSNESDLLKSEMEFLKIWLDAEMYSNIDIHSEIPFVIFDYNNTSDFIESLNYWKWLYREAFDYQGTRVFHHFLLRIIALHEPSHSKPFHSVLHILKDTSRPYLLWTLYNDIQSEFPYVIPYLLTDSELLPIAFKLIDKIEIDTSLLSEQSDNDRKCDEGYEVINKIWLELFDVSLELLTAEPSERRENGELIAKILMEVSDKVYSLNKYTKNSISYHNSLKKRYEGAFKKIASKRIDKGGVFHGQYISPRLIHVLFEEVVSYMKRCKKKVSLVTLIIWI